jgi:two-component sensor histidine kinase
MRESGGPPVRPPDRKGFGSRLIEQSLAGVGGSARVEYGPAGLVCTLECPSR